MSESYFPNHPDANANGASSFGYPGTTQQRPFDHIPTPGQPLLGEYPSNGYAGGPPYGHGQPPTPGATKAPLPRQIVVALAGAAVLVLALGGLAFTTHGKLADAETKVDGLEQSLDKANKTVTAKQSEVESTAKELATAQQEGTQLEAAYSVAATCATQLDAVFDLIIDGGDSDQIYEAYQASREACDQLDGAQSSE